MPTIVNKIMLSYMPSAPIDPRYIALLFLHRILSSKIKLKSCFKYNAGRPVTDMSRILAVKGMAKPQTAFVVVIVCHQCAPPDERAVRMCSSDTLDRTDVIITHPAETV